MASVLIIGKGGREDAIAFQLAKSPLVLSIQICPGNGGTDRIRNCQQCFLNPVNQKAVLEKCTKERIDMVIIGPEGPLADGLVNILQEGNIQVFGPTKEAAQLETSKIWAKNFMVRNNIPTSKFVAVTTVEEADYFLDRCSWRGIAVKASGLAGGKGVKVVKTTNAAKETVRSFFDSASSQMKAAANVIVLEEELIGFEISVIALVGGGTVKMLPPCQDHKKRYSGDEGPNTGGMGAICPYPFFDEKTKEFIQEKILQKAVDGIREEGFAYSGALYAGLMITEEGPMVLEFNCRFGDPETQALLPLMKSDLYLAIKACINGTLAEVNIEFEEKKHSVAVIVVNNNYPEEFQYTEHNTIEGLEAALQEKGTVVYHSGTKAIEDAAISANGGRVLTVSSRGDSLREAAAVAIKATSKIRFCHKNQELYSASFRGDIALQTVLRMENKSNLTYKAAGVDVEKGEVMVRKIANVISKMKVNSEEAFGLFGSIFDLKLKNFRDPLLVSGTDGVGTKLKIATQFARHQSIGVDLVAMSINDILVHAAEPLYFLDYFSTGKLDTKLMEEVIQGVAEGCSLAKCPLVGGETAEMPDFYEHGQYDLAGFAVGAVERDRLLPKSSEMSTGDVLIGISSSGLHSNGFSLVRRVVDYLGLSLFDPAPFQSERKLGDILLTPTKIYRSYLPILSSDYTLGAAHITGGGLKGNICRVLPDNLIAKLNISWPIHQVFLWLFGNGISAEEMFKTFNMGLGLVIIIKQQDVKRAFREISKITTMGQEAWVIGTLDYRKYGGVQVTINDMEGELLKRAACLFEKQAVCFPLKTKKRVAVLISGTGTNLQALLDHSTSGLSIIDIVLVISNVAEAEGLNKAVNNNVPTQIVKHEMFAKREYFEDEIHSHLLNAGVEFVFLAGFMRILTSKFVSKWRGKLMNVHPSLLPSFKGANAVKQALLAGVTVTGCTVHFVEPEVDAGAIIVQKVVPIKFGDTEETLGHRIRSMEHIACPRALELVVKGEIALDEDGNIRRSNNIEF